MLAWVDFLKIIFAIFILFIILLFYYFRLFEFQVNMSNIVRGAQALFPPKRAILQDYYLAGYKHAFRYLEANEMLKRPEGTPI